MFQSKRARDLFAQATLMVLGPACGAGCMLSPGDGAVMGSGSEPVTIGGFVGDAGVMVQVEGFDDETASMHALGRMVTSVSSPMNVQGTSLYQWTASFSLPWGNGTTGQVARLSASSGGGSLTTYTSDWASCLDAQGTASGELGRFYDNCKSKHQPYEFIYTPDYPTSVDLVAWDVELDEQGSIAFTVRNGGRHGYVTQVVCNYDNGGAGQGTALPAHDLLSPLDRKTYTVDLAGGVPFNTFLTCGVLGTNEDGTPEPQSALGNNMITNPL